MSKDKNNGFVSQLFSGDICAVKAQNSAFHSFAQYSQYSSVLSSLHKIKLRSVPLAVWAWRHYKGKPPRGNNT